MVIFVFFFKQKTAYEMRISDWSSDVCSSDLFATSGPLRFNPSRERCSAIRSASSRILTKAWGSPARGLMSRATRTVMSCVSENALTSSSGKRATSSIRLSQDLDRLRRSEEHTSELQSLMRTQYAVLCLKKKTHDHTQDKNAQIKH